MQIRELPLTVHESLDLRGGAAGWQSLASGCLRVPQCRTLKFPGCGAQPPVWSRPLLPAIERALKSRRCRSIFSAGTVFNCGQTDAGRLGVTTLPLINQ